MLAAAKGLPKFSKIYTLRSFRIDMSYAQV